MRAAILILLAGCWSHARAPAPPSRASVAKPAPATEVRPVDAPMDCSSRVEDSPPGNHDRYRFEDPGTQLVGFKDGKGRVVISPQFRFAYEFGPAGVAAAVDATATFVYISPSGATLAQAYSFDNGPDYFQEGYARIVDGNKKIGFISERGDVIIHPQFDEAAGFCHGLAEVVVGGVTRHIDPHGTFQAPPAASSAPSAAQSPPSP